MYLSPNWIRRGDTVVAVILPKLGAPRCVIAVENWVVVWLANWGVLNVLKNSVRNCTVPASLKPPTLMSLKMDMSMLCWPGPYTTPRSEERRVGKECRYSGVLYY